MPKEKQEKRLARPTNIRLALEKGFAEMNINNWKVEVAERAHVDHSAVYRWYNNRYRKSEAIEAAAIKYFKECVAAHKDKLKQLTL